MELGLSTGSCISPHLETVRERITFSGKPIDEEGFARIVDYLKPYIEMVEAERGDNLTYQEVLTVMAFEALFDRAVHVGVLETGLGGEYDASNVAHAQVAVITNVTLDHVKQFGMDLSKAAWEKAGIIKSDSFVVTGVSDELLPIVESRAQERDAKGVVRLGREFEVVERRPAVGGQVVTVRGLYGEYDDVFVSLYGAHQADNAALSIAACEAFAGEALDRRSIESALGSVRTIGRIDVAGHRPPVILDGGHNPAAASAVREAIEESFAFEKLIVVVGMLDDKLIEDVLALWSSVGSRWHVVALHTERAAAPERLVDALLAEGVAPDTVEIANDVGSGLSAALDEATPEDLVLVFGSFHTVGDAMPWLRKAGRLPQS
jgi:dihydrofolate synthase/folylpolyglutamate synthase